MSVTGVQHMEPEDNNSSSTTSTTTATTDGPTNSRGRTRRRNRVYHNLHTFDNAIHDFLLTIPNLSGQPGMFYMSNPADYVYGRVGLDSIVTQLLNQMDSTGPPPLAKDKIAEIPKVGVTAEQVEAKLQCSICWEDFQISETVRQLPCVVSESWFNFGLVFIVVFTFLLLQHIYHENCIIPWLELHGTCPVCRQTLSNDNPEEQQQAAVADATNTLRKFICDGRHNIVIQLWRNTFQTSINITKIKNTVIMLCSCC